MATQTIAVAPGVQISLETFTPEEQARFVNDWNAYGNLFTRYTYDPNPAVGHAIRDLLQKYRDQFLLFAQAAKNDIDGAGVFQGINATNGFGMVDIRPDFLVPTAQGRTFDATSNGTGDAWSGLYHNGAISAAYGTNPLYLRKETAVAICGFIETHPTNYAAEEVQWEINGKPLPIWNMVKSMKSGDLKIYEAPQVIYLPPRKTYRSQYKTGNSAASTAFSLQPIGVSFVTADVMRNTAPTQPSTTPP